MADKTSTSSAVATSAASPSASKFELSIADGSKTTVNQLAKNLMPLLIVTLKADTALCNKQLKAISELEEEGVFADKCTPIAVLVGTLNEIEHWEAKMQLKYTIVQGTPEFLELLGCCSRGKVKRSCVLLGGEDNIEFIDTAIKSGVSFVPKLKEYLATVAAKPAAAGKGKKATAASKSTKKASVSQLKANTNVEVPPVTTPVAAPPKLKLTRKSVSEKVAAVVTEESKSLTAVKKAASKKRVGPKSAAAGSDGEKAAAARGGRRKSTTTATATAATPQETSADLASTSTPPNDEVEQIPAAAVVVNNSVKSPANKAAGKVKASNGKARAATSTKNKRRTDPTSDIESPAGEPVAETQTRQRKRIKIAS